MKNSDFDSILVCTMYTMLSIKHIFTHTVTRNSPEVTLLFSFSNEFICLEHNTKYMCQIDAVYSFSFLIVHYFCRKV